LGIPSSKNAIAWWIFGRFNLSELKLERN